MGVSGAGTLKVINSELLLLFFLLLLCLVACLCLCIFSEFEPQAFAFDNQIDKAPGLAVSPFEHGGGWFPFGFMCIL